MADNQLVSNSYLSTNSDIRPRAIEKSNGGKDCLTQVMALDIGGSGAESLVTVANPLPITGSITLDPTGLATDTKQDAQTAILTTIDADTGAIAASVAAIDADATTIIGHVDGIEALLTTISGNVDGVETLLGTIDTSLNNIEAASGAVTPAAPAASSVGVASAQILASATYKRVDLTNTSTSTISIGIGAAAVLNSGMTLIGTGSTATIEGPFTAAVNAIASGAASNLAIQAWT
jgi:hypothetical protein